MLGAANRFRERAVTRKGRESVTRTHGNDGGKKEHHRSRKLDSNQEGRRLVDLTEQATGLRLTLRSSLGRSVNRRWFHVFSHQTLADIQAAGKHLTVRSNALRSLGFRLGPGRMPVGGSAGPGEKLQLALSSLTGRCANRYLLQFPQDKIQQNTDFLCRRAST